MAARIFINHPKVGTILIRKSRPNYRSRRFKLMNIFMWKLSSVTGMNVTWHECKVCGTNLINPQSILLHIGNGCESKKQKLCFVG